MISLPCFESCLFCEAICFVEKVTSMFIGQLLNFLKILDDLVSQGSTLANQAAQKLAFPNL